MLASRPPLAHKLVQNAIQFVSEDWALAIAPVCFFVSFFRMQAWRVLGSREIARTRIGFSTQVFKVIIQLQAAIIVCASAKITGAVMDAAARPNVKTLAAGDVAPAQQASIVLHVPQGADGNRPGPLHQIFGWAANDLAERCQQERMANHQRQPMAVPWRS